MPIPKIEFRYSWIYDERYRQVFGRIAKKDSRSYPTTKQLVRFINRVEPEWRRIEQKVLCELARITKLPWEEKVISCYVVGRCCSFSDPLTISATNLTANFIRTPNFIDILIHELIHRIFTQAGNERLMLSARSYIAKTYKHETRSAKVHVLVHAIHSHIYLSLFNQKRLERNVHIDQPYPDYRRAWEIVRAVALPYSQYLQARLQRSPVTLTCKQTKNWGFTRLTSFLLQIEVSKLIKLQGIPSILSNFGWIKQKLALFCFFYSKSLINWFQASLESTHAFRRRLKMIF